MPQLTTTAEDVAPEHLFEFDLFRDERLKVEDIQSAYATLHDDAPEIFFTPANGGHWVVTRYELITEVLRNHEHFSASERDIPKSGIKHRMIPLYLDPPEHGGYRVELMRYFSPKVVHGLEGKMRAWAVLLIEAVIPRGTCNFAEEIAARFPVSIFMEIMGIPLARFTDFRKVAVEYFNGYTDVNRRTQLRAIIISEMESIVDARRVSPQDDLISHLISMQVHGNALSAEEIRSICLMMFIAGLDTVTGTLGFAYKHLAQSPTLQARLATNPADIKHFIEESLRRYAVVVPQRVVTQDYEFAGVKLRAGDMIVAPLPCAGLDENKYAQPEQLNIDRSLRDMISFGTGVHSCMGHFLARAEMRILTEEWLRLIPRFRLVPGTQSASRLGPILALDRLEVEWDDTDG